MIIGIDVGGTHTDGVLIEDENVRKISKVETRSENLQSSILTTLDNLINNNSNEIERIVFSTTLTTNLIAQGQYPPTGLALVPGPGMKPDWLKIGKINQIFDGSIDHRGHRITSLNEDQVETFVKKLVVSQTKDIAIVGKFSTRNPVLEENLKEIIQDSTGIDNVQLGSLVAPRLNFPRRAATTWLNTAVYRKNRIFFEEIKEAIRQRGIEASLYLLKADGGTLPLEDGKERAVETIKSGPAASIMGFMALTEPEAKTALLLDIGGTTTDIALLTNSHPLFEPEGVTIDDYITSVQGLLSRSIPYGGDSKVVIEEGQAILKPKRVGPAVIFGGSHPTLTDALAITNQINTQNRAKAIQAFSKLIGSLETSIEELAHQVINFFNLTISNYIDTLLNKLNNQPVYTIHELLEDTDLKPEVVMMIGGPAQAILPGLAQVLKMEPILPPFHHVANALGAALARPTMSHSLYADTSQQFYRLSGISGSYQINGSFNIKDAKEILIEYMKSLIEKEDRLGLNDNLIEITHQESFNIVRRFSKQGQIIKLEAQIKPGIDHRLKSQAKEVLT